MQFSVLASYFERLEDTSSRLVLIDTLAELFASITSPDEIEQDMFVTVTKIGTGLTDREWQSIRERTKELEVEHKPARVSSLITPSVWVEPELVIEVLADEITRSPVHTAGKVGDEPGYALRFPRLVSFRERDKKPEDATTVQELIEMHHNQGKIPEAG